MKGGLTKKNNALSFDIHHENKINTEMLISQDEKESLTETKNIMIIFFLLFFFSTSTFFFYLIRAIKHFF